MKKLLYFILALNLYFSLNAVSTPRNGTVSGDYVIYKDSSFVSDTWVGFLFYDENTYGAVLYTPSENRRVGLLFSVDIIKEKLEITGQKIVSKIDQKNQKDVAAVNYLMQLLPDFYNWSSNQNILSGIKSKTINLIKRHKASIDDVQYFSGSIDVQFASFIPIFYIENIYSAKGNALLELEKMGRVGVDGDPEFFNFLIPFPKKGKSTLKFDKNAKNKSIEIDEVKLNLDTQWKTVADNYFMLNDSAILTIVQVPSYLAADFKNDSISSLIKIFSCSNKDRTVLLKNMLISGNKKKFTITNEIYDNTNQNIYIDIKRFELKKDTYILTSLTANKADYFKFKKYFDNLY